jgi:hypothetical protein
LSALTARCRGVVYRARPSQETGCSHGLAVRTEGDGALFPAQGTVISVAV